MIFLEILLFIFGAQVFLICLYLGVLALLARRSRAPGPASYPSTRFDVIVPAHDEERGIAETVESLGAVEYPRGLYRIVVIADNCTDRTAEVALSSGARVLERREPRLCGKGYALAFAFDWSLRQGYADAVVVVDADTVVSRNLLRALDIHIRRGANAIQCRYGVRNVHDSWRTRLMQLAFTLFHDVRSLGRERLNLSSGLRGNGMCFTRCALVSCPPESFSMVEDVEYGIDLGRSGVRVEYADEAWVKGEIAVAERAARSQRLRWENGRADLSARYGARLFIEGFRERSPLLIDLAIDLALPPLSTVALMLVLGALASFGTLGVEGTLGFSAVPWIASAPLFCLYIARGVQCSERRLKALADLAWAPVYVVWKLSRLVFEPRPKSWVRTARSAR